MERRDGLHPNHPKPDETEQTEKMQQIWEWRSGSRGQRRMSFREIGDKLGISHTNARKLFHKAVSLKLEIGPEEEAERILALQQIEEEEAQTWELYEGAFDEKVKLLALIHLDRLRKSKREILGLDAATKFDVRTTQHKKTDLDVMNLIEEHNAAVAEQEAQRRGGSRGRHTSS